MFKSRKNRNHKPHKEMKAFIVGSLSVRAVKSPDGSLNHEIHYTYCLTKEGDETDAQLNKVVETEGKYPVSKGWVNHVFVNEIERDVLVELLQAIDEK